MIRFKVFRGSHVLLAFSAFILAIVIVFILLQASTGGHSEFSPETAVTQNESYDEAKALSAFASNSAVAASLKVEILKEENNTPPLQNAPSILIYHTHTHEAYEPLEEQAYEATEAWRTSDDKFNIVRVGAALEDALAQRGFFVVHDTTDHELDDINLSYVRALESLESYSMDFDFVIDLHRDAYIDGMLMHLDDGDSTCAQIMLLVGDGGDYQAEETPDYSNNLAFAHELTTQLNRLKQGIARNVTVKHGRFNQHIGKTAALIEVGHNRNTLDEALASVPVLAEAIALIAKTI